MSTDTWAGERDLLQEGLRRAADEIPFSHAALVREQIEATPEDGVLLPGMVCLRAAQGLGVSEEDALPGAMALVLLAQMGRVFTGLESQDGSASLSTAWGMPRALNAGDAFFAAAQHAVLADEGEISVQRRLAALSILDDATRGFMSTLNAGTNGEDQSLRPAALLLAGVYAGADDATMARLRSLGPVWAEMDARALEAALSGGMEAALAATKSAR